MEKSQKSAYLSGEKLVLSYVGNFDLDLLKEQIIQAYPEIRKVANNYTVEYIAFENYSGGILTIIFFSAVDAAIINYVIKNHDATAAHPIDWKTIIAAKNKWMALPNYATWTAEEAEAYIESQIFSGWTQAQIDLWIDTNVTNIATAKTALKTLTVEIMDLKEIVKKTAYLLMLLRDIVVKRSLL